MGLRTAWKTARVANLVEKNIKRMMETGDLQIFKKYQYGSKVGNHVFDQLIKNTQRARLGDVDYIILALIYFTEEARCEKDECAYEMFKILLTSYHATYGSIVSPSVDHAAWTALGVEK